MRHVNRLSKVSLTDTDLIVVVFEVILKCSPLSSIMRLDHLVKIVATRILLLLELDEVDKALSITRNHQLLAAKIDL